MATASITAIISCLARSGQKRSSKSLNGRWGHAQISRCAQHRILNFLSTILSEYASEFAQYSNKHGETFSTLSKH